MVTVRSALLKVSWWSDHPSKMIRTIIPTIPLGQRSRDVRAPGSIWSGNLPTNLVYGSTVAVVVDEGALQDSAGLGTGLRGGPCSPRCTDPDARTQPFTMPMLTPTEKNQTMSGWRKRVSVSFLIMGDQEKSEKTEVGACRRVLDLGRCTGANFVPSGHGGRLLRDERERSIIMDRQDLSSGSKDGVSKVDCLPERYSFRVEETNISQD